MTSIDICVCTYGRRSLTNTLESLAGQTPADVTVKIVVADNDVHDSRRDEIEALAGRLGLDLRYVHAPARNISIARNACLDVASADWIAFIDDDEVAAPSWLERILSVGQDRDIVFGPVHAVYPKNTPNWMKEGDFHSTNLQGNDAEWNGHTGNVLIAAPLVRSSGLRFAEQQGLTGGEDTLFFFEAMRKGASFGYAPSAMVREFIDPRRLSLWWLIARRFRSGQTHHLILRRQGDAMTGSLSAVAKFAWSLGAAALSIVRPANSARNLLRAGLHAGVIAAAVGFAPYREYDRAN